MPATALPASGAQPEDGALKTCDASGMEEIHRMFRAGFREGPALLAGVREGDSAHASAVARRLEVLSAVLHAHHEGEDERLWPTLESRAPSCAVHVARMKAQHAEMLVHLTALDAAIGWWRATAAKEDASPILEALAGINSALGMHLGDEEENIVPVMETTLTQPEVQWFADHGRKTTPKGESWNQLGAILASQPDGGHDWLHKHMPAPVRLIWRWIGKRKYEAQRATLTRS